MTENICVLIFGLLILLSIYGFPSIPVSSSPTAHYESESNVATVSGHPMTTNTPKVQNWFQLPTITPEQPEKPISTPVPTQNHQVFTYTSQDYEVRTFTLPVDLKNPPLKVQYTVKPKYLSRTKWLQSDYGQKKEELITYDYASPDSWFIIRILDEAGNVIKESGYGCPVGEKGSFGQNEKGSLMVYSSGKYTVNIRFNDMIADINVNA